MPLQDMRFSDFNELARVRTRNARDVYLPAPVLTMYPDAILSCNETVVQQLYWFQAINASEIFGGAAIAPYYAYSSSDHGQGTDGIRLWTAAHPVGPWTYYGKIYDDSVVGTQTETPFVIWDPDSDRLNMYYSQSGAGVAGDVGTQSTMLAHSPNGITSWTRVGIALNGGPSSERAGDGHTGYARVLRIGNDWYARSLFGGTSTGWGGFWWSGDGVEWVRYGPRLPKTQEGLPRSGTQVGLSQMFLWYGQPWLLCGISGTASSGEEASDSAIGVAPLSADLLRISGPVTEFAPDLPWQTGDLRSFSMFVDVDGTAYVYWLTKDGVTSSLGVGVLS